MRTQFDHIVRLGRLLDANYTRIGYLDDYMFEIKNRFLGRYPGNQITFHSQDDIDLYSSLKRHLEEEILSAMKEKEVRRRRIERIKELVSCICFGMGATTYFRFPIGDGRFLVAGVINNDFHIDRERDQ